MAVLAWVLIHLSSSNKSNLGFLAFFPMLSLSLGQIYFRRSLQQSFSLCKLWGHLKSTWLHHQFPITSSILPFLLSPHLGHQGAIWMLTDHHLAQILFPLLLLLHLPPSLSSLLFVSYCLRKSQSQHRILNAVLSLVLISYLAQCLKAEHLQLWRSNLISSPYILIFNFLITICTLFS